MFWLITLKRGTLWIHQHRLVPFNITIEQFSVLHVTLAMSHLLKVTRTKLPRSVFVPSAEIHKVDADGWAPDGRYLNSRPKRSIRLSKQPCHWRWQAALQREANYCSVLKSHYFRINRWKSSWKCVCARDLSLLVSQILVHTPVSYCGTLTMFLPFRSQAVERVR